MENTDGSDFNSQVAMGSSLPAILDVQMLP